MAPEPMDIDKTEPASQSPPTQQSGPIQETPQSESGSQLALVRQDAPPSSDQPVSYPSLSPKPTLPIEQHKPIQPQQLSLTQQVPPPALTPEQLVSLPKVPSGQKEKSSFSQKSASAVGTRKYTTLLSNGFGIQDFEATKLSQPKQSASIEITEEFHPDAGEPRAWDDDSDADDDNDDENDSTASAKDDGHHMVDAQRWAKLVQGAREALKFGESESNIPAPVLAETQRSCEIFRDGWKTGHSAGSEQGIERINHEIAAYNEIAGEPPSKYRIPARELLSFYPRLRYFAVMWAKVQIKGSGDLRPLQSFMFDLVNFLRLLRKHAISWKSVTTAEVNVLVNEIVKDAAQKLQKDFATLVMQYILWDQKYPTALQREILRSALSPITMLLDAVNTKDDATAKKSYGALLQTNEKLMSANRECGFRFDDHLLPLEVVRKRLRKINISQSKLERRYLGAFCHRLGFTELGELFLPISEAENISLPPEYERAVQLQFPKYEWPIDANAAPQLLAHGSVEADAVSPLASGKSGSETADLQSTPLAADYDGVLGPMAGGTTTFYGEICGISKCGRGYRICMNVGTKLRPVYKNFPGNILGRGIDDDFLSQHEMQPPVNIKARKGAHIKAVKKMYELDGNYQKSRAPQKYLVEWHPTKDPAFIHAPPEEWVTWSDLKSIAGTVNMANWEKILKSRWNKNLSHLEDMKRRGLHPDTQQPLAEKDKKEMPWLFDLAEGLRDDLSMKQNIEIGDDDYD